MFNIFVYKFDKYLLDTVSDYNLALEIMKKIQEIKPDHKVFIEPMVCRNNIEYTINKYKELFNL